MLLLGHKLTGGIIFQGKPQVFVFTAYSDDASCYQHKIQSQERKLFTYLRNCAGKALMGSLVNFLELRAIDHIICQSSIDFHGYYLFLDFKNPTHIHTVGSAHQRKVLKARFTGL